MDAWRNTSDTGGQGTLEDHLCEFFNAIKNAHTQARLPSSQMVVESVFTIVRDFKSTYAKNKGAVEKKRVQKKRETGAIHQVNPLLGSISSTSSSSGMSMLSTSFPLETKMMPLSSGNVTIKCFFNGDNRVLDVPSDISLR